MLVIPLTPASEARIAPLRRLGVEIYVVGIYWAGTLLYHSNHMSEQGCIQWAYKQVHQDKKDAISGETRTVI